MNKIIFAGLLSDKNLGDKIIADCTIYLYNTEIGDSKRVEYILLDLAGFKETLKEKPLLLRKIHGALNRIRNRLNLNRSVGSIKKHIKYYESKIIGASLIVIVGGGMIKYKYQKVWLYTSSIIHAAKKHNIPIILNSIGVEDYDEGDFKCQYLKEALNHSVVKVITTRDDLRTLNDCYLRENNTLKGQLVADPAVFASSTYDIQKDRSSNIIGLGLIRANIFIDNNIPYSKNALIQLYIDIIIELNKRGIVWKAFTNGLPADLELAEEIFKQVGIISKFNDIIVPSTSKELVETISKFKGVIAARLHACIISYSLEIPAIGLVWNNKLQFFGDNIGYSERFFSSCNFDSKVIVDQLEKAVYEGYDNERMKKYKMTIKDSIENNIKEIL